MSPNEATSPASSGGIVAAQGARLWATRPSRWISVRLEPSLRIEAAERAMAEGVTVSEVIRRALREYLQSA